MQDVSVALGVPDRAGIYLTDAVYLLCVSGVRASNGEPGVPRFFGSLLSLVLAPDPALGLLAKSTACTGSTNRNRVLGANGNHRYMYWLPVLRIPNEKSEWRVRCNRFLDRCWRRFWRPIPRRGGWHRNLSCTSQRAEIRSSELTGIKGVCISYLYIELLMKRENSGYAATAFWIAAGVGFGA